jgi:hypothetical protein
LAPRGITRDRDPVTVTAEFDGVLGDPLQGGPGIVDARGEGVLGSEAVVHRHHDCLGTDRMRPRHVVVGVEVADRPAATVVVHDDRQTVVCVDRRPVDARRDVGDVAMTDRALLDSHVRQHLRGRLDRSELLAGHLDAVVDGELQRHRVEKCLQVGVDARTCHVAQASARRRADNPRSTASVAAGTTPAYPR